MVVKRSRLCFNVLLSVMFMLVLSGVVSAVPAVEEMKGVYQQVLYPQSCGLLQSFQVGLFQSGVSTLCYRGSNFNCDATTNGKRYKLVNYDAAGLLCLKDGATYKWNVCASDSEKAKFSDTSAGLVLASYNQQVGAFTCKKNNEEYWAETKSLPLFSGLADCGAILNGEAAITDAGSVLCSTGLKYTCDSASVGKIQSVLGGSMLCSSSKIWGQCGGNSNTFSGDGISKINGGNVFDGYYCDGTKWVKEPTYELVGKPNVMRIRHPKSNTPLCSGGGDVTVCSSPAFSKDGDNYITGSGGDVINYWTKFQLQEVAGGYVVLQLPVYGVFEKEMTTLCSSAKADSGDVESCAGIRDDAGLSSLWKEIDLGNGQFTLQHVKSGQYLCASTAGKVSDMVGKCANQNRDDFEWSTKFVRADEICDNGIDDDSDGLTDCSDDMCYGTASCMALWKGKWNVFHSKSGQYMCGSVDGKVEMCQYAQRKATDSWQAVWNIVMKTTGPRNYMLLEDVYHIEKVEFKGIDATTYEEKQRILCSANTKQDDTVKECIEEQELGMSAPWQVIFKSKELRFEHGRSNEYLCAEGVKGKYGVEKCGNQDRDDIGWSTRWVLNAVISEDCSNGKDDDLDGTIDCLDSDCTTDVKCKVVCTGGTKCGGKPAKGLFGETVCGTDFKNWRCINTGWIGLGSKCTCAEPEVLCLNRADDDGDGKIDCSDSDCFASDECKDTLCKECMNDCLIKKDKSGIDTWTCVDCELDIQCSGGKKCIGYKCGFPVEANPVTCVDSDGNDIHTKGGVTLLQGGKVLSSEEDSCVAVDIVKEMKCGMVQGKVILDYDAKKCAVKPQEYCLNGACQTGLVLGTLGGPCDEKTVCPDGFVCDVVKGKPELGTVCLGGEGGSCANSNFCAPGFVCKNNKCVDVKKFAGEVICDDGIDNDKDGKIDCVDSDCDDELNGNGFVCCSDEGNAGKKDATPCSQGTMCDDGGLDGTYQCLECIPGEKECAKGSCVQGKCVSCDDPDEKNPYVVKSTVKVAGVGMEDYCVNGNVLKEYFCIGEIPALGFDVKGKINFKDFIDADEIDCATQGGTCVAGKCVGKNFCENTYEKVGKKVGKAKEIVEKFLKLFSKGKYAGCLKGDFNSDGVIDADDSTDYVLAFRKAVKEKVITEQANLDESGDNVIDASDTTDYVLAFRNYGQLKK